MSTATAKTTTPRADETAKRSFLAAFLRHVPTEGWSDHALALAAMDEGFSSADIGRLFPDGVRDAAEAFGEAIDDAMQARIRAERGFARFRVRDKVAFALRARLEFQTPHREAARRLMVWYALPLHALHGFRRMSRTVDLIWRAAGDTSTDYNYYTKRILLAAVMKATFLFWLDDASDGCEASWAFLDRRIGDVMKLGKSVSLLKEFSPSEIAATLRRKFKRA